MSVGYLIKTIKFPFLEVQRFIILEVRILPTKVDLYKIEMEQHHSKFARPLPSRKNSGEIRCSVQPTAKKKFKPRR